MSVNIVNKTTGDLTRVAGNATDKVGNLNALTTTDKTSIVGGVNEINAKIGDYIDISSNVTVDSHITLTNNNLTLQKIGKMVFANLMFYHGWDSSEY